MQRLQSLVREQLKRIGALEAERKATQPQGSARGFGNSSYPRLGRSKCGAAINLAAERPMHSAERTCWELGQAYPEITNWLCPRFAKGVVIVSSPKLKVVVVGGGFSGTALAIQLLRRAPDLPMAIIDKGSARGRGLAYASKYRFHLLNVPAGDMSALPEEPDSFLRWARANYASCIQARSFLSRGLYGTYLNSLWEDTLARGGANFRWIQDEVLYLKPGRSRLRIRLKQGLELSSSVVVLATGNFPPANPKVPGLTDRCERYVPFAWSPGALEDIPHNGSVLLLGSGLTSLDLAICLKSKGFSGKIHIISRRGLLPQPHRQTGPWHHYWNEQSPRTTRGLLQLIRREVRRASAAGIDWRAVIDALRQVTPRVWQSLSITEQRRFLRHARSYWEAHRHRVAPQIGDLISDLIYNGQLTLHAGRLVKYREQSEFAEVTFRDRGWGVERTLRVDRVINCTGSETDCRRIDDPLIMSLFAQGLARPDPLFLGLDVDATGALLGCDGESSPYLYAIGPTRKGHLWETTAVPEIRTQASQLAGLLLSLHHDLQSSACRIKELAKIGSSEARSAMM